MKKLVGLVFVVVFLLTFLVWEMSKIHSITGKTEVCDGQVTLEPLPDGRLHAGAAIIGPEQTPYSVELYENWGKPLPYCTVRIWYSSELGMYAYTEY